MEKHFAWPLVEANDLLDDRFSSWALSPGMAFGATHLWWGRRTLRKAPHEGVDLLAYLRDDRSEGALGPETLVPALADGEIIHLANDFLGRTIFMRHPIDDGDGAALVTALAHVEPKGDIAVGQLVSAGQVLARIASPRRGSKVPAHLHLTAAWAEPDLDRSVLEWECLGAAGSAGLRLVDPLEVRILSKR